MYIVSNFFFFVWFSSFLDYSRYASWSCLKSSKQIESCMSLLIQLAVTSKLLIHLLFLLYDEVSYSYVFYSFHFNGLLMICIFINHFWMLFIQWFMWYAPYHIYICFWKPVLNKLDDSPRPSSQTCIFSPYTLSIRVLLWLIQKQFLYFLSENITIWNLPTMQISNL